MDFSPILVSLRTASVSIVCTFFLGILAARWVGNFRRGALIGLFDGLFTLPLVLPPTVVGFLLLSLLGVGGPVGRFFLNYFSLRVVFSWWATVIASVVISFPLMYRAARGAFEQVDPDLLRAARTLGMGENRIFWRVLLPLALPGVLSGAVLAFARGLGEFGTTILIAGNIAGETRTLPLAVYSAVAGGDTSSAYFYAAVTVGVALLVIWAMHYFAALMGRYRGGRHHGS